MWNRDEILQRGKRAFATRRVRRACAGGLGVAVIAAAAVLFFDHEQQPAQERPQMHRAVYDLTLADVGMSSSVQSLEGRMVVEWRGGPGCEGYISEQRVVTNSVSEDDNVSISDVRLSSWESLDGNEFRYSRTEYLNGEQQTSESGYLHHDEKGVILDQPNEAPKTLPADTEFPNVANMKLIAAAKEGKFTVHHRLFDGTQATVSNITAFIGKPGKAPKDARDVTIQNPGKGLKLKTAQAWPVHMSYFDEENRKPDGTPNFEMGVRLFPNGVMSALTLRYDEVTLKGTLSEIEYFKPGAC